MKNVNGFYFCKRSEKYISTIQLNRKRIWIGTYKTAIEAKNAYLKAKEKYHIINN